MKAWIPKDTSLNSRMTSEMKKFNWSRKQRFYTETMQERDHKTINL